MRELALEGDPAGTPPRVSPGETARDPRDGEGARPGRSCWTCGPTAGSPRPGRPRGRRPRFSLRRRRPTPVVQRLSHAASSLPGSCRLRLVVAPADLDLAAASPADIERAASRLALVDLTYETERP